MNGVVGDNDTLYVDMNKFKCLCSAGEVITHTFEGVETQADPCSPGALKVGDVVFVNGTASMVEVTKLEEV